MYIQRYARKYAFAGSVYPVTLLSSASKAGPDAGDALRKPAQRLRDPGQPRWQSTASVALETGSPGCCQPWFVGRKTPTSCSHHIQIFFILQSQNAAAK